MRTRMRRPLRLLIPAGLAVTAGLAVAVIGFTRPRFMPDSDLVLRIDRSDAEGLTSAGIPYCLQDEFLCLTEPSPGHFVALFTRTTHETFRAKGCDVRWRTDLDPAQFGGTGGPGVFREPCGGATFDIAGTRIFGPAPRDLDRIPVVEDDGALLLDLRGLCTARDPGCR